MTTLLKPLAVALAMTVLIAPTAHANKFSRSTPKTTKPTSTATAPKPKPNKLAPAPKPTTPPKNATYTYVPPKNTATATASAPKTASTPKTVSTPKKATATANNTASTNTSQPTKSTSSSSSSVMTGVVAGVATYAILNNSANAQNTNTQANTAFTNQDTGVNAQQLEKIFTSKPPLALPDFEKLITAQGFDIQAYNTANHKYGYTGKPTVCEVERVVDGDTFRCILNGEKFAVRLRAVDAPEMKQEQGGLARSGLAQAMPANGTPTYAYLYNHKKDRYGRTTAFVVSAYYKNNRWHLTHLTSHLVNKGYVWITDFKKECGVGLDCQVLNQDFEKIQKSGKGIWAYPNNIEPNIWRKQNK